MECRYYLDNDPARTFADAERALIALSQDGIMQGEMVDRNYPGISIYFDIETGIVNARPIFVSDNHITYLYADSILDVIANMVREGIATVARLFLFDELVRIVKNDRVMMIVREAHYDATGQRINFELNHCRETQRRILSEVKPGFTFLKQLSSVDQQYQHIYKILLVLDLNEIRCTHDAMAKVRVLEMGGGPRPAM